MKLLTSKKYHCSLQKTNAKNKTKQLLAGAGGCTYRVAYSRGWQIVRTLRRMVISLLRGALHRISGVRTWQLASSELGNIRENSVEVIFNNLA